ncbi:MAG: PGPGW domain-containing protein [Phenylobacterium sp.]|uniref:PGPGW domain-containing protein n=1 Tax=Phenylobacterium sp. TaxID=1871053 RepID=UPI0027259DE7|nr:PGPGW domain-containing protein [Phenylobacterium sp.]MDO8912032.1 PGPGW domain-containing protein [Phenylobacterium sp.]MDO9246640.1 PGPGW domain-containing protein [Phenylobacterium sp.]MDP2010580.1 PGPGW domain-containing protein [Phenylobacterium sp.]MDP3098953.1 PGPGW domain-containing protein [Phenylobacterium sp.]MDP3632732.1 PGPGW domain-containing protein [Phenylobacterium sp.]
MPSMRALRASDELARELVARLVRVGLASLGVVIVLAGIAVAPLPGPGGLPVIVVGLMLLLRNSFKARRTFVRFQHAHPKMVFPIRRLLRREPEILLVSWQQVLRIERLIVPRKLRFAIKTRRRFRRR